MIRLDSPSARLLAGASAVAATWFAARHLSRPQYSFRDRTVIITGATRGLGLAMARRFVAEGARVWLIARSTDELAKAADELAARGGWVRTIAADVRRPDHVSRLVDTVLAQGDPIDVLVNNAGIIEMSPMEHATREDFQDALATHFWGPLDLIRAALPHMRRNWEGRILNIASIGGRVAVPHLAAYTASKFALVGLSESLRAELLKEGILVTTVTPGLMRTGSYVNVKLRGRHRDELRWFTAMSATPLTSMRADRAARIIVEGCRVGRATLTPGVQARLAVILNALAPNVVASLNAAVDRTLLPRPLDTPRADIARSGTEVDPGLVKKILRGQTRRQYHQPQPAWR
jgi:NAD(P)-dependent dehydrogenase (short-subunit alcohol dehydrogenase family)